MRNRNEEIEPVNTLLEVHPGMAGAAPAAQLGWVPALSLTVACGIVVVALGDTLSRHGSSQGQLLFWLGLLILVAPVAMRLVSRDVSRGESITLVVMLGIGLYLMKVLQSPVSFTIHDEFLHWRTAHDIQATGHLFHGNPLLPVSPLYPVTEAITVAVANLGHVPLFISGLLVIGAARLVLVLSLYLFYWEISRSTQLAGVAATIYLANPNSVFFDAMFSYESLALGLAMLALFVLARRTRAQFDRNQLMIVALVIVTTLAATHHLTSYILIGFLFLWAGVYLIMRRHGAWGGPGIVPLVELAVSLLWLVGVASITIQYIAPHVQSTLHDVLGLIERVPGVNRAPFQTSSGIVTPLWQRMISILSALLLAAGVPFGAWIVWGRFRNQALALTLGIAALLYPATLGLRLTSSGWEIANRSSEFIFLALGFTVGAAVTWLLPAVLSRQRPILFSALASIIFIGGIISGWKPAWVLPGPYIPADGPRSVEPEGVNAAYWARDALGPHHGMAADHINGLLMGSYGEQATESTLDGGVDTSWLYLAPQIGSPQEALIRQGHIQYLLTDLRLTRRPPLEPQYDGEDPRRGYYLTRPITPELLTKFDHIVGVSRIFDSGDIRIYNVGIYDHHPKAIPARSSTRSPARICARAGPIRLRRKTCARS